MEANSLAMKPRARRITIGAAALVAVVVGVLVVAIRITRPDTSRMLRTAWNP